MTPAKRPQFDADKVMEDMRKKLESLEQKRITSDVIHEVREMIANVKAIRASKPQLNRKRSNLWAVVFAWVVAGLWVGAIWRACQS